MKLKLTFAAVLSLAFQLSEATGAWAQACPPGFSKTCVPRTRMQPTTNQIYTCTTQLRRCQRSQITKDVPTTEKYCYCAKS